MFVVSVHYVKSLEDIDSLLKEHIEFLKVQFRKKIFIASGRKIPRTGGIIIANTRNREELGAILEQDPFYKDGAAEYEITEFVVSITLPELESLNEA